METLSLIIALLAVIVGPMITYRIAKKNLTFQFLSLTKEKWIDKLEESSHSFLNSTIEWIEKYRSLCDGTSQSKEPNIEIDRMLNAINSSIIKLQLLLDPLNLDQKYILDNVIEIKDIVNKKTFNDESITSLRKCHESIITRFKKILNEERLRIIKIFR